MMEEKVGVARPATTEPTTPDRERTWTCKVTGPNGTLPQAADFPMRQAVREAYHRVTGIEPTDIWSGWGNFDTTRYRAGTDFPVRSAEAPDASGPSTNQLSATTKLVADALDDAEWALNEMHDPLAAINAALDRIADARGALAAAPQEPRWPSATRENAVALAKARTVIREEAWDEFDDEERGYWIDDSQEVLVRLHEADQA